VTSPNDTDARSDALYCAWLCGTVLGAGGMALHHKICHTLGGSFDTPHAETHAFMQRHTDGTKDRASKPGAVERVAAGVR
ncbi:iron-containing alcohol dehydrogenase, partial [Rhizobium ruizarguesonis]